MEQDGNARNPADTDGRETHGIVPDNPLPALEIRPDHKGRFDEIVARFADGVVHVETMHKKGCYVGFYWDDGRYCQWWISSDKKLEYHHEDGVGPPPRFTAQGVDRLNQHTRPASPSPSPAPPVVPTHSEQG